MYGVVSELASRKHNPEGARWFSIALGLSMLLLWPAGSVLRDTVGERRWPILALRAGILFGMAVGIERLVFARFSHLVNNGHEALAVGAFAGLYTGLLGLYGQRIRRGWTGALAVAAPLAAIFIAQIVIYFDQRDLGWVDHDWREMGVSPLLSFAFWQWIAVAMLWVGLGTCCGRAGPGKQNEADFSMDLPDLPHDRHDALLRDLRRDAGLAARAHAAGIRRAAPAGLHQRGHEDRPFRLGPASTARAAHRLVDDGACARSTSRRSRSSWSSTSSSSPCSR